MISKQKLRKVREILENSNNPLFFFDNDTDGLCAFIILKRSSGKGKGVAIKTYPDLKDQYLKKVEEINPDVVFILDKAEVSKNFIQELINKNIEVIWIDHHKTKLEKEILKKINYLNPMPDERPTTYIAQKIYNRSEDEFIAMIGCIGDVYKPEFGERFEKNYPEIYKSHLEAFEALHKTELGKMIKMLNFGLMDKTTNVLLLIKLLTESSGPYDILEENQKNKTLHKRYKELNNFFTKQMEKARAKESDNRNLLFFTYSGDFSMSSEISNKLMYENPEKLIVVGYLRPEKVNLSIRGENALEITNKITKVIPGSTGGGHEKATGAMIPMSEFENFKKELFRITK